MRKGYVSIGDGQMHYRHREGISPPIVFLHQTALSSRSYDSLLHALPLPNELIALDTPGFGGSFEPPGWPSMQQYGQWILEALTVLGTDRAHFFGHHTGASLATQIASSEPTRVLSLMLCGPVAMTAEERREFGKAFAEPLAPGIDGAHLLQNWGYTAANNPGVDASVIHAQVVDMMLAWRARPQAYVAVAHHDFLEQFARLRAPMLILSASDDYFASHVDRCSELRPDIRIAAIRGGNLATELDAPGIAAVITKFISSFAHA